MNCPYERYTIYLKIVKILLLSCSRRAYCDLLDKATLNADQLCSPPSTIEIDSIEICIVGEKLSWLPPF